MLKRLNALYNFTSNLYIYINTQFELCNISTDGVQKHLSIPTFYCLFGIIVYGEIYTFKFKERKMYTDN